MTDTELLFDPSLPGLADDPYPHYARLRRTDPVHEHPAGYWMVSRHDDATAILRAPRMSVNEKNLAGASAEDSAEAQELPPAMVEAANVMSLSLLDVDPPDHTRLRSLVTKAFTPRSVVALEPTVTELVDEALDRIADGGRVNLMDELAFPVPFAVISHMLGTPSADSDRIRELTGKIHRSPELLDEAEMIEGMAAIQELVKITREMIDWKRAHPADDLLTALIAAEHEGDKLTADELVAQVLLLYAAGHETTVSLIGGGVAALLHNPDQLELLRRRPELAENAVEEFLRYDPPIQQTRRITTAPYPLRGKEIPAGSLVMVAIAAANRDEDHFGEDADKLRIDRPHARQHVSFGAGVHHCFGSALAKMEGRIAISRLVDRFGSLAPAGDVAWNDRVELRSAKDVPITV
ncbi:cytochrome P450 [Streptomyces halobius]|uniref:Cytochrome P450 n=1 Tax=Streptomyces halobius TaxID=2879846 RepID=A0ABY4M0F6_9ACTN|nr:cytochrome P450 [Streptomyces halobius]UQA90613.1 cytochrome P450 [Streptomyces halobius]